MSMPLERSKIAVASIVPTLDVPFATIRSPRWGAPVDAYAVCPKMLGVWTHYYGGRTIPHLSDRSECDGCKAERAKRWKGYFGLYSLALKDYILAECTQFAAAPLKRFLEDPELNLRGARIILTRTNRKPNARVKLEIQPNYCPIEKLPREFDMLSVLLKIWSGETYTRRDRGTGPSVDEEIPA